MPERSSSDPVLGPAVVVELPDPVMVKPFPVVSAPVVKARAVPEVTPVVAVIPEVTELLPKVMAVALAVPKLNVPEAGLMVADAPKFKVVVEPSPKVAAVVIVASEVSERVVFDPNVIALLLKLNREIAAESIMSLPVII